MALFRGKVWLLSALLLGTVLAVQAEGDDAEEATVETVEEEDIYQSPKIDPKKVYLAEHFDNEVAFNKKWVKSEAKKQGVDDVIAKYDGKWEIQLPSKKILKNDLGLVLTTEAKHAAIAALLDRPFEFTGKPLIVQYEVTMQEGQNCGGAYLKLLSRGTNTKADLRKFHDQTPYTIMFGPDKCGNDNKLHFIFRHRNPKNGTYEEKHSKKPNQRLEEIYKDKEPHLYTLIVRPDNTFTILIDNKEVNSGSLLEDFTPPVNPPEEIDDPNDKKPDDWDEREKIVDPSASKPLDWDEDAPAQIVDPNAVKPDGWLDDEPENIPDPEAVKPSDWDEEMDGSWEPPLVDNPACTSAPGCGPWVAPTIPNPDYKGPWRAPLITNPNYAGRWTPRRVHNPHYFNDPQPYRMTPIHAVGFELWSMSPALLFDNLIVTDDEATAQRWAEQTFILKRAKLSRDSDSALDRAWGWAVSQPWVAGGVALAVTILLVLVIYLCCVKSDSDIDYKKTDAYTEDDPVDGLGEGEGEVEGEGERERDGEGEGEGTEPAQAQAQGGARGKAELEHDEEPDTTEPPLVDTEGAGDGQRKRKPRRE